MEQAQQEGSSMCVLRCCRESDQIQLRFLWMEVACPQVEGMFGTLDILLPCPFEVGGTH